jgi:hypothetical protein
VLALRRPLMTACCRSGHGRAASGRVAASAARKVVGASERRERQLWFTPPTTFQRFLQGAWQTREGIPWPERMRDRQAGRASAIIYTEDRCSFRSKR